jgi:hypothetical protein
MSTGRVQVCASGRATWPSRDGREPAAGMGRAGQAGARAATAGPCAGVGRVSRRAPRSRPHGAVCARGGRGDGPAPFDSASPLDTAAVEPRPGCQPVAIAVPVGADNLCHQVIFMSHASGAVTPPEAEVVQAGDAIGQRAKRRGLVQGAVKPGACCRSPRTRAARSSGAADSISGSGPAARAGSCRSSVP